MPEEEKNVFEDILLDGINAITKTAETAADIIEELVKKGDVTAQQGKIINEELKHGIKEGIKGAKQVKQSSNVSNFVDKMHKLTPEELMQIRAKIDELEEAGGN